MLVQHQKKEFIDQPVAGSPGREQALALVGSNRVECPEHGDALLAAGKCFQERVAVCSAAVEVCDELGQEGARLIATRLITARLKGRPVLAYLSMGEFSQKLAILFVDGGQFAG